MSVFFKIKETINWLANYIDKSGQSKFFINFTNNSEIQCFVTAALCIEAGKIANVQTVIFAHELYFQATAMFKNTAAIIHKENNLYTNILDDISADGCGLLVGIIDRTTGLYNRSYKKNAEYLADIFPLYNIEFSDVLEMYKTLFCKEPSVEKRYLEETNLIEFAHLLESKYQIITSDQLPTQNKRWPFLTQEQKQIVAILYDREKKTRHKIVTKPYP